MSAQDADDAAPDDVAPAVAASADDTEDSFPSSESGDLGSRSDEEFLRAAVAIPELAPPTEEPDRVGTELGHFKIRDVLGRGGMGIVYGAEDSKLGRRVALKVLPVSVASDTDRRARLLREARAASVIGHPNIAAVYEVGEAEGHIFIAMECVEGQTLRKRIEQGRLAPEEAVRITREIARALTKAHAAGIVHRDLKPDNVMVDAEGLVKILDFGLAKPIGSRGPKIESATVLSTVEGRILGTPSYMSPEQAKGKEVDGRSDLFSLGVLLYEMLSGKRPFTGEGTMEILIAIDRDTPKPLTRVPRQIERIVSRCLAKDPSERFATGEELIAALDATKARPSRPWLPVAIVLGAGAVGLVAWQQSQVSARASETKAATATPQPTQPPRAPMAKTARESSEPLVSAAAPSSAAPVAPVTPSPKPVRSLRTRPVPPDGGKRDPLGEQK